MAYYPATSDGCFIRIQTLLNNRGASLPVFASAAAIGPAAPAPLGGLPELDSSRFVLAIR